MGRSKSKATMSLDPELWEQFKRDTDSASETVEELIQNYLGTQKNEVSELKAELKELEVEKKKLEQEKKDIENKLSKNISRQESLRSAIEQRKKEQSRVDTAVEQLLDEVPRKGVNGERTAEARVNQLTSKRVYHNHLEKVDVGSEELQERIVQRIED